MKEANATIVYSSDKKAEPKYENDLFFFRLPNRLRELAGGLGKSGPGELSVKLLKQADEQLDRKALDFHDWSLGYLGNMSDLCVEAINLLVTERPSIFKKINLLAHELWGQGGTFGYPLITHAGKSLFYLTLYPCSVDDDSIEIVKAHIDTMRIVFRDKITGDGDETARALKTSY